MKRAANPIAFELLAGLLLLTAALVGTVAVVPRIEPGIWLSLGLYLAMAAGIWRARGSSRAFGWPNRVTLLRSVLMFWLAAWIFAPAWFSDGAWTIVAAALMILLLDGLDGHLARRLGQSSDFGARFDMEVDAALILLLCVLTLRSGQAGPWVLLIGLMRYVFLAAMAVLPWMTRPLPESRYRKVICVWQVASLIAVFVPGLPAGFISLALAVALVLLIHSFALDTLWLYRRRSLTSSIERSGP